MKGIWHTGLTVADMKRSKRWYMDMFGMECTFEIERDSSNPAYHFIGRIVGIPGAKMKICYLECEGGMLELIEYIFPRKVSSLPLPNVSGTAHLAFWVEHLKKKYPSEIGRGTVPDGRNKGNVVVYLRDPDGFIVELVKKA